MKRREFNTLIALSTLASGLPLSACSKQADLTGIAHKLATLDAIPNPPLPKGKGIPFNWDHCTLNGERSLNLTWQDLPRQGVKQVWLRIASATDVRPRVQIEVRLRESGLKIAHFDLQYGYMGQLFETEIPAEHLSAIQVQGLSLHLSEGEELWLFQQGAATPAEADLLCPHLLLVNEAEPEAYWLDRLLSYNSIQFFGWAEGVTLDGLYETKYLVGQEKAQTWFQHHLNSFFDENQQFVYNSVRNKIVRQRMDTVEGVLPFAIIAKFQPDHPAIQNIIDFCYSQANAQGEIADGDPKSETGRHLATETNYTISYPLCVIAQALDKPDLYRLAAQTIFSRKKWLRDETGIYQHGKENTAYKGFKNWGRGVAWYVLGLARTLEFFPSHRPEYPALKAELLDALDFVRGFQAEDGLFNVFLHEPETQTEITGAAGVGAAIALCKKQGFAREADLAMLAKIRAGLKAHFTPDGFLTNAVQHNAGGRELQANGYRTISQYALGFYAIMEGALRSLAPKQ